MITALLDGNIIDCESGEYSRDCLKDYSAQNKLICPACRGIYEYCHGECISPYFRHKDKCECDQFSEPETEEHSTGKRNLYEWIRKQDGVTDAILEGWLPETRQRPDIMFKWDGTQYAIEYQCSPISTEYLNRHSLYKNGNIKCIWILGTQKYLDYASPEKKKNRDKEIEYDNDIYYDPFKNLLLFKNQRLSKRLGSVPYSKRMSEAIKCMKTWAVGGFSDKEILGCCSLDDVIFNGSFSLSDEAINRGTAVSKKLSDIVREASFLMAKNLKQNGAWGGVDWTADFTSVPIHYGGRKGVAFVNMLDRRGERKCKKLYITMYYNFTDKKPEWNLILSIADRTHEIKFNHHSALLDYLDKYFSSRVKNMLEYCVFEYGYGKPYSTNETVFKKVV